MPHLPSRRRAVLFAGLVGFTAAFLFSACPPGAGGTCGPDNCSACCNAEGRCAGGSEEAACGKDGVACADCTVSGLSCIDQQCGKAVPNCGLSNCPNGCCTVDGVCLSGAADPQACGAGGAACADCGAARPGYVCNAGACGPPPCQSDFDCAENELCNPDTTCRTTLDGGPMLTCQVESLSPAGNCTFQGDYCVDADGDGLCVCVKAERTDAGPFRSGYCKRRLSPCSPCRSNDECGDKEELLDPIARCVAFRGADGGTGTFCLNQYTALCNNTCGSPYGIPDAGSFCAPSDNRCAGGFFCCTNDADCPRDRPNCNLATGRCDEACLYDFVNNNTVGCRPDHVCHVKVGFLNAADPRFGQGRCAPSCQIATGADAGALNDQKCKADNNNRTDYVCRPEIGSLARCRPQNCLSDVECPESPAGDPYKGYCDKKITASGITDALKGCRYDCRIGTDPATGTAFSDCKGGYKCVFTGATNQCVKVTCIEAGGAELDCASNQYCCGENTKVKCPAGLDAGNCFNIPKPPWCATGCQSNADCQGATAPNYSTVDKNTCLTYNVGGQNVSFCFYACEQQLDCPSRHWRCREIVDTCASNADCVAPDGGGQGLCAQTDSRLLPDGGRAPFMTCVCNTPDGGSLPCPGGTRCGTEIKPWQGVDYKRCILLKACDMDPIAAACP